MSRSILCPGCGLKVMTYDDKGSMKMKSRCKGCRKLVIYNPMNNTTTIGTVPERDSSSGKRFY